MANLLEKANILITPTAYSDGKIHSAKPIEATADLNFTRGSAATRVNAQGLIENVDTLGSEEVVNGGFATDSDWTKGIGWTINEEKASSNGSQTGNSNLFQGISFTVGKQYKVSYEISDFSSGTVKIVFGDTGGILRSENGNYIEYFTFVSGSNFFIQANSSFVGSISNVSVKEVIDVTNIPRINYKDGVGSWLIEPQSTNLVTYSEDFSDVSWQQLRCSIDSNIVTSPNGNLTSDKIIENSDNNNHSVIINGGVSVVSGTVYTISCFVKEADFNRNFNLFITNTFVSSSIVFDFTTETFSFISGTFIDYGFEKIGDYYKVYAVATATVTGGARIDFGIAEGANTTYLGDSVSGIYIWGAQIETGSTATSYIPTNGSVQTRLAETASRSGLGDLINSEEGVFYAEILKKQDDNDNFILISLNNESSNSHNDSITIGFGSTDKIYTRIASGGSTILTEQSTASTKDLFYKIAIKYNVLGDNAVWVNGIETISNSTSFSFNEVLNNFSFDYNGNGVLPFYGNIKALAVLPILTDQELECLTTR